MKTLTLFCIETLPNLVDSTMKKLVIFASGSGTNAENIINHFKHSHTEIACVFSNKKTAGVLDRCDRLGVPGLYFNRNAFESGYLLQMLKALSPDMIVLAGFLWKIPENWIATFPKAIVNIHPALLPKYGGKGMYGSRVHEAVKANGDTETGITIHFVNQNYDEGAIIHQAKTKIASEDTPADIARKVHELEYADYPKVIEKLLRHG